MPTCRLTRLRVGYDQTLKSCGHFKTISEIDSRSFFFYIGDLDSSAEGFETPGGNALCMYLTERT